MLKKHGDWMDLGSFSDLHKAVGGDEKGNHISGNVETEDVSEEGLRYVCRMCGLELKVETATTDRAPTHCREKMELINVGGSPPPLRPV